MSKTHFTPGPLSTRLARQPDNCGGFDVAIVDSHNRIIAEAYEIVGDGIKYPCAANAHLISAAPEMYEAGDEALAALYGAREVLGDVANISHAINMLESAARKARGEN